MYELLGILFMHIISMEILRKVKGKKRKFAKWPIVILWKSRGKMVISQKFKKILEGPKLT